MISRRIACFAAALAVTLVPHALGGGDPAIAGESRLVPRVLPEKSVRASLGGGRDSRTLILKLRDGAAAVARDGRLHTRSTSKLSPGEVEGVMQVLQEASEVRVEPIFDLPAPLLDHLRAIGERNSGEALADLTQYFLVLIPEDGDPVPLVEGLLPIDAVEHLYAYRQPRLPADLSPPTTVTPSPRNPLDQAKSMSIPRGAGSR